MADAIFYDTDGIGWHVYITVNDVLRVRNHVTTRDGKPLDLFYIAETGDFKAISGEIETITKCVYWLLYPLITEYCGKTGLEAQEWFYSRINGEVLPSMIEAWKEGIVNFTPTRTVRVAMITAMKNLKKAELVALIKKLAGLLETYTDTQVSQE